MARERDYETPTVEAAAEFERHRHDHDPEDWDEMLIRDEAKREDDEGERRRLRQAEREGRGL